MKKRLETHIHHRNLMAEILNPEIVKKLFIESLAENNNLTEEEGYQVAGVQLEVYFAPRQIACNAERIKLMLKQLNPEFKKGWSFLQLVLNGLEFQWTSLHLDADMLLCLGLATGHIEYCTDREYWPLLPGGVPYIRIINLD